MSTTTLPVKPSILPANARCSSMRSAGYDPTGVNAVECKAPAAIECEYCGPMCGTCSEENSCLFSEHKVIAVSN